LDTAKKFAGAVTAGWRAFNISSDKTTGLGGCAIRNIVSYLSIGRAMVRHASGPMGEASTIALANDAGDVHAVVALLRSVPAIASAIAGAAGAPHRPQHRQGGGTRTAGQDGFRGRLRQLPWLEP